MSNRTDYANVAREIATMLTDSVTALERIETDLHNAHVAGSEGSPCGCSACLRLTAPLVIAAQRPEAPRPGETVWTVTDTGDYYDHPVVAIWATEAEAVADAARSSSLEVEERWLGTPAPRGLAWHVTIGREKVVPAAISLAEVTPYEARHDTFRRYPADRKRVGAVPPTEYDRQFGEGRELADMANRIEARPDTRPVVELPAYVGGTTICIADDADHAIRIATARLEAWKAAHP